MKVFQLEHGIILACDLKNLDCLTTLVKETCNLNFMQGYKIGVELVVPYGIYAVTEVIRRFTDLPIIYDHQKFGTDIPDMCSGKILNVLKDAGVKTLIIFPQAGIETLKAAVLACKDTGIVPIVGGEMTHRGYLARDEGYIENGAPERMYRDASKLGVEYFVVPGTKIESIRKYKKLLLENVEEPKILFPGIGKGQGGDIVEAFNAAKPCDSYAIVGRGIYEEREPCIAAERLWSAVSGLKS